MLKRISIAVLFVALVVGAVTYLYAQPQLAMRNIVAALDDGDQVRFAAAVDIEALRAVLADRLSRDVAEYLGAHPEAGALRKVASPALIKILTLKMVNRQSIMVAYANAVGDVKDDSPPGTVIDVPEVVEQGRRTLRGLTAYRLLPEMLQSITSDLGLRRQAKLAGLAIDWLNSNLPSPEQARELASQEKAMEEAIRHKYEAITPQNIRVSGKWIGVSRYDYVVSDRERPLLRMVLSRTDLTTWRLSAFENLD